MLVHAARVKWPLSNEFSVAVGKMPGSINAVLLSADVTENPEDTGDDSASPVRANVEKCRDLLCKKYLTKKEWPLYNQCVEETNKHPKLTRAEGPLQEENPTPCAFYNGTAKKGASLLVSYPGSGNTWLRGLLQQATGVCAGSHFCDVDLRRHGFPAEGIYGTSVILVKAHFKNLQYLKHIDQTEANTPVVFLIRNPFHAIVAERTRLLRATHPEYYNDTHISSDIDESQFGKNSSWVNFWTDAKNTWKNFVLEWVIKFKGPLCVAKYEDLVADAVSEVLRILDFLKFDYNEEVVRSAVSQEYSRYQRKQHASYNLYTAEQERDMLSMLNEVSESLVKKNKMYLLSVEEYKLR